jgi:hypothetical protein
MAKGPYFKVRAVYNSRLFTLSETVLAWRVTIKPAVIDFVSANVDLPSSRRPSTT